MASAVSSVALARELLAVLDRDMETLERIDRYDRGEHDDPYMPPRADDEYRLLAKRAVSNWMPLLVGTPAQALYVDGFRPGAAKVDGLPEAPSSQSTEWSHWQRSRLDARQAAIYRGALKFGHSFVVTERTSKGVISKGLSALKTAALYEDPANDETPYAALTIVAKPKGKTRGKARMWDAKREYEVTYASRADLDSVRVTALKPHGASECPVTRFAASVDLEGRTIGVIEPMISLQDRINQTVFDTLVAQTYTSHEVRYATGMAPPMQMELLDENGAVVTDPALAVESRPKLGPDGHPIPEQINHNARRFLFAEDPDVKFGSLPAGPIGSLIDSVDMSIRHLAAISQTPPHHLLGQIANLSAEALLAAETALARKVGEFRSIFGEAWERVFRLAAELEGQTSAAEDFHGEVKWRDMESRSLAQAADALGKLADLLGIPRRGLWKRVPGVTQSEYEDWVELAESEDSVGRLANALTRATPAPSVPATSSEGLIAA
ncbi:phage portal protein [Streptomyces sp. NPDC005963]|uniref:phage portal protein n=1 Tax=Streptomyces sp. NPDC005963 TaxID=3156721 RepID=UPI0033DD9E5A